ncbi:exosortase A [uncultured Lamprocystis sp.]|jgi:exosortase A|uniref:exosortase A n=1 Tax=uncultured Lamprocystis sp. TaxID=543132 RepID=UPI0025DA0889|nr:exosortase A [uncultured Lamprocystis sp.]
MEPASENSLSPRVSWAVALPGLAIVLLVLLWLFFPTVWSLVSIWLRSDTYAHGAIVLPISLWLIWEKRAGLANAVPQPTLVPTLLMLPVGSVWLLGSLTDVLVIQQYGFVCLLILAIWSIVGTPVTRFLAFPLGFLLLAVPAGEALTYPLMNLTADFTVGLLRLTGIPVYRDGTFFSLPSGDWSVVEECSGVRYLLASVTLGMLFAYLNFSFLWKRLVFVLFSVVVPVFANGLRAYLIVMIGHLSNMKLATGVDHLIYGWVFFGIVIAIMFWFGSMWRDPVGKVRAGLKGGG